MKITFETLRQLKKYLFGDRAEAFENILATDEEIEVHTLNHFMVNSLDELREWTDVYQGKNKTKHGFEMYGRCVELQRKYNAIFTFEHEKNLSSKERTQKVLDELIALSELKKAQQAKNDGKSD